jgi:hypothetical protein
MSEQTYYYIFGDAILVKQTIDLSVVLWLADSIGFTIVYYMRWLNP